MTDEREEAIRLRAYAIWNESGRPVGQHLRHWWQADQEVSKAEQVAKLAAAVEEPKAAA